MSRKLEELFDLPETVLTDPTEENTITVEENKKQLAAIDQAINKIDEALPLVKGLDASDREMDELADLAKNSFNDLMDLGMQVDSRFAGEIFSTASTMLSHAITAKTAKMNKKLRMIDLQLKKARLDQVNNDEKPMDTAQGVVLSRNELLEKLLKSSSQNSKKE
jgi:hypothetical protein